MDIGSFIVCTYLVIGFILSYRWWKKEYEPQYNEMKENGEEVDEPMAVILLLMMMVGWPIKMLANRLY